MLENGKKIVPQEDVGGCFGHVIRENLLADNTPFETKKVYYYVSAQMIQQHSCIRFTLFKLLRMKQLIDSESIIQIHFFYFFKNLKF